MKVKIGAIMVKEGRRQPSLADERRTNFFLHLLKTVSKYYSVIGEPQKSIIVLQTYNIQWQ